jgi:hypothetical protein
LVNYIIRALPFTSEQQPSSLDRFRYLYKVKNISGRWRCRRVRNSCFERFLSSSLGALVSSRYITLVICRPEGTWVMELPNCYDGIDRGKKGVIVLQPSLSIGDVRSSGIRIDGDESSHRFAASGNGDRLPTIGHTP